MGDMELENVTFWPNITDVFTMEHFASLVANSTSGIFDHDLANSAEPTGEECYDRPDGIDAYEFTRFERDMGGYATCAVGLFGIIGNMINLGVLSHREMRGNCFNQLLIGINVFDSLHIVFAIMESFRLTFDEYYPNFLLHSFPWFHFPIYRITLAGSIYMMIATAIERHMAVCSPHVYHELNSRPHRILYYIIPVTLAAVIVNIPRFLETTSKWTTVWDDNCTETQIVELIPTDLRLNKYYIIGYVNWVWTLTTVLIPFFALLFLTISIFTGLRRVRKNLNRHKRLEGRAARVVANVRKGTEPSCTIQVRVTNENGVAAEAIPGNINPDWRPGVRTSLPEEEDDNSDCELVEDENVNLQSLDPSLVVTMVTETGTETHRQSVSTVSRKDSGGSNDSDEKLQGLAPPAGSELNLRMSLNKAKAVAQRKILAAAQSREANMALVLVCTVLMFIICHAPRLFTLSYEAALAGYILECVFKGKVGVPFWFLYVVTIAKFLIVLNASGNFIIYLATGSTFRVTFFKQIASVGKKFRQRN